MPRNTLKSFPTAMLRSGLAHFHPVSRSAAQPAAGRGDGGTPRLRATANPAPTAPSRQSDPALDEALAGEEQIAITCVS